MTLAQLWSMAQESTAPACILLIAGASLIEMSPVKVNPWSWAGCKLRAWLGITEIREELENARRTRILRFDDELIRHIRHRKDMFEAIIIDCDMYERYCNAHKGYINSIADDSIKHIKAVYHTCKEHGDFLLPEENREDHD